MAQIGGKGERFRYDAEKGSPSSYAENIIRNQTDNKKRKRKRNPGDEREKTFRAAQ